MAISVSSSPVNSQQIVGVGEYVVSGGRGGGDRPRISLLPAPASIPPAASPTAPTDYHAAAAARNNRVTAAGVLAQIQDYRPSSVDMAQMQQQQHQEAPPFKKIRLGPTPQQLAPTQQQQQQQQSIPQTDSQRIVSGQDVMVKSKAVQQLPPLRIDTRVCFHLCVSRRYIFMRGKIIRFVYYVERFYV